VSQTLDAVLQKGQTMPEKNRFPAVLQPICATGNHTHALTASSSKGATEDGTGRGSPIVIDRAAFNQGENAQYDPHIGEADVMDTVISRGPHAVAMRESGPGFWMEDDKAGTLRAEGENRPSRPSHVIGQPHIVQASELRLRGQISEQSTCPTLLANTKSGDNDPLAVHAISFQPGNLCRQAGADPSTTSFPTLKCDAGDQAPHVAHPVVPLDGMNLLSRLGECGETHSMQEFNPADPSFTLRRGGSQHGVLTPMAVRRLTPNECLRLQGFPDNWTNIPWKGKPTAPDGPQYKCAGNSFAVPVVRWIGTRIAAQQSKQDPQ
jgi:DNA (cytosine-5)-methyltransferase 1